MGRFRIDRLARVSGVLVDPDKIPVLGRCHHATSPLARTVGLLGTRDLGDDEGVWIRRCGSVHTIGMRVAIDVAFLDDTDRVLRVVGALVPWRIARQVGALSVVEGPAGSLAALAPGVVLTLRMSH